MNCSIHLGCARPGSTRLACWLRSLLSLPLLLAAIAAAAAGSSQLDLPDIGEPADNTLSPQQEKLLGGRVVSELYRDGYALEDPQLTDYLNSVGWKLAGASATRPPPLTFFMVEDNRINAFALPGGYIGVNAGLLMATRNESELAGVMGHELAHVTQRHIARTAEDTEVSTIATWLAVIAAIIAGSSNPDVVMGALVIGQSINYQRQVSYTRAHEQEADRIGIQTMSAAGFDPRGMASFFGTLQQQSRLYGNGIPEILLTHPLSVNRIAEAETRADELPKHAHEDSIEYSLMRSRARVLTADTPGESLEDFATKLASGRDTPANRYGLALAQQEHNEIAKASATLAPLVDRYPRQPNIQMLNAELLGQSGKRDQALQAYQTLLRQYPRYAPAILSYSEALMNAGQPEAARQYLISHDQAQGTQMLTYRLLAQAARETNNIAESAFQMSTYLSLRGDPGSALSQLDAALRLPDLTPQDRARLIAKRKEVRQLMPRINQPV